MKTRDKLIKKMIGCFGNSVDLNQLAPYITMWDEFVEYEKELGLGIYAPIIAVFRSLDGVKMGRRGRVRITTACHLYLFDIVKK